MSKLALALFIVSSVCQGQEFPDSPSHAHTLLKTTAVGLIGLDAWATARNQGPRSTEVNPLARPLVRNNSTLTMYFASGATAFWFTDRVLTRKGHHRTAVALDITVIGLEAYWSGYSIKNHGGHKQ